jgi:hypothetical protein
MLWAEPGKIKEASMKRLAFGFILACMLMVPVAAQEGLIFLTAVSEWSTITLIDGVFIEHQVYDLTERDLDMQRQGIEIDWGEEMTINTSIRQLRGVYDGELIDQRFSLGSSVRRRIFETTISATGDEVYLTSNSYSAVLTDINTGDQLYISIHNSPMSNGVINIWIYDDVSVTNYRLSILEVQER